MIKLLILKAFKIVGGETIFLKFILLCILLGYSKIQAQQNISKDISKQKGTPIQAKSCFLQNVFIKNIGQYGSFFHKHADLGEIKYGYEGFIMPVLFTPKGIIYLHREVKKYSKKQERELEAKGESEEIIERGFAVDKAIAVEWINANSKVEIIADSSIDAYFTYGLLKEKTYGFRRVIYKDLYPNIDLIFNFNTPSKTGFEYTFVVRPNGNINDIKIKYSGDINKITTLSNGNLFISSGVNSITESNPLCFTTKDSSKQNKDTIQSAFTLYNYIVSFNIGNYDKSQTLNIDPFVSSANSLVGANQEIAKDIDFDYNGNIYVTGGGDGSTSHKLAKYSANGSLQWVFNGTLTIPSWDFGSTYGGWVVEKFTGNVFLGQGVSNTGSRIIRLNNTGLYDNFITTANGSFIENWKMIWNCNSGTPEILIGGGSANATNTIGTFTPPNTSVNVRNVTGRPDFFQDIGDMIRDPLNNDLYIIFSTGVASLNNRIYKLKPPYTSSSIAWNTPSGYSTLAEISNRPYLSPNPFGNNDNSANLFAVNSNYLFYWDGLNLKAFNKANGNAVGTPLTITSNTRLWQGGIIADECNNIFVGNGDGTIKVFKFNGTTFDDAAATDIVISGFYFPHVYDLAYDQTRQLLYACGNGFVASFDVSGYCTASTYTLNVIHDCNSLSAQATITPTPPRNTVVTYELFIGSTLISNNTTGLFTGLAVGNTYTVKAYLNQVCGGLQLINTFALDNCVLSINTAFKNPTCIGTATGSITATASSGTPPYLFSIDGINFQTNGFFNNLTAGTYIITVKDFVNATTTSPPIILDNSTVLKLSANVSNNACGLKNGIITATASGGIPPFQYSLNGGTYQSSNSFNNLSAGNYNVYVKDVNNCIATTLVTIIVISAPTLIASATPTNCNNTSGTIVATAGLGSTPYQYSIDGVNFQTSNIFEGLAANNYLVTLKDASGCIKTFPVTVGLNNTLTVNAGIDITICEGTKRKLSATSNGTTFTWSPSIGLDNHLILNPVASPSVTTNYFITAKEGVCTKSSSTTVFVNPAPIANAGKDTSICFGKDAQLNGSGVGNISAYQWNPLTFLNNSKIHNPISIKPNSGIITYILSVTDTKGCKSVKDDSINIHVSAEPKLFAGNDTAIIINEPFQLTAIDVNNVGFNNYNWSPGYGLSSTGIYNPVAILNKNFTYSVTATNNIGCVGTDNVSLKVYNGPHIYVPNAFTPNNDNLNDNLKVLPVGMIAFKYFSIYNRYGQLIFTTTNPAIGWDGTFKGIKQSMGTYVWMVEATDFRGLNHFEKGVVVLIR